MRPLFAGLADWLPGQALTLGLWCGLIVLTVWLLLLARTRWGQARPIAKCVVLSLFAHLLLGIYAYGTRILVDYPLLPGESSTTRVKLVDASRFDEVDTPTVDPAEPLEADSQLLEATDEPLVDTPEAELPRVDPQPLADPPASEVADSAPDLIADLPLPQLEERPEAEPADVPLPEAAIEQTAATGAAPLEEAPLAEPARHEPEPAAPPAPPAAELARQPLDAEPGEQLESTASAENDPPNTGESTLQTLTENLVVEDAASARASEEDESASSNETSEEGDIGAHGEDESVTAPPAPAIVQGAPAAPSQPRRPGDGAELPHVYQARSSAQRTAQLQAMGGDEQTEAAVERALQWLAANQSEEGHWHAAQFGAGQERMVLGHDRGGAGAKADTGITGLALLGFFGAGHTHFEGPYRKNVQHGLEFLLRSQREDGFLGGDAELFASMYCHGIAFLALSEAYAMTGDARLKPFVQRAQRYTLDAQIPYDGGWRYRPGDSQGDMSQFGWQVMALRSAEVAGLRLPRESRQGMLRFMNTVSSGQHGGRACYRANTRPSRTMTAEAVTCRFFLQLDRESELEKEAADFLMEEVPGGEPANFYYWYYGSLAMFQLQDPRWPEWNQALKKSLLPKQRLDGELAGSWDANTVWGGYGGRVYTTAMATMCLEVYYRYLPLYQSAVAEHPFGPRSR